MSRTLLNKGQLISPVQQRMQQLQQQLQRQPVRHGRFIQPGHLHLPFHERFDINTGDRLPKPHPETPRHKTAAALNPKPVTPKTKPFKVTLKANAVYWWCSCGLSHSQPLCDGHHNRVNKLRDAGHYFTNFPNYKPMRLQVNEDKEVWLCQCKRTANPPFCDGSHRSPEVQRLKET